MLALLTRARSSVGELESSCSGVGSWKAVGELVTLSLGRAAAHCVAVGGGDVRSEVVGVGVRETRVVWKSFRSVSKAGDERRWGIWEEGGGVMDDDGGGGELYLMGSSVRAMVGGGDEARSARAERPAEADESFSDIAMGVGVVGVMSSVAIE